MNPARSNLKVICLLTASSYFSGCNIEVDDNAPEPQVEEIADFDGDGVADELDIDDDNDGVVDTDDAFPLDSSETTDSDGDGIGDNTDIFPNDPNEHLDSDGDGVGDNADAFPNDSTETVDTDGDGIGNNADEDDDNDGLYGENRVYSFESEDDRPSFTLSGSVSPSWLESDEHSNTGNLAFRAAVISDNEFVNASITIDVTEPSLNLAFWYLVSSEEDYDFFTFSINDIEVLEVSGEQDWTRFQTTLETGSHTLTWRFEKDDSVSDGLDTVWIDDILFSFDNCPLVANEMQEDMNNDGEGDACDDDIDGDGALNDEDAFPTDPSETLDTDADGFGNNIDIDDDGDTIPDAYELTNEFLDPLNADDALYDEDSDGYSNLDEFWATSDPSDSLKTPETSGFKKYLAPVETEQSKFYSYEMVQDNDRLMVARTNAITNLSEIDIYKLIDNEWTLSSTLELNFKVSAIALKNDLAVFTDTRDETHGYNSGAAHIYHLIDDNWIYQSSLYPVTEEYSGIRSLFGFSVLIIDNQIIVGAYGDELNLVNHRNAGAVYVFEQVDSEWQLHSQLRASDFGPNYQFGQALAYQEGTLAISAPGISGESIYIFEQNADDTWTETQIITPNAEHRDSFGIGVIFENGDLYAAMPNAKYHGVRSGAVAIYQEDLNGNWSLANTVTNPNSVASDRFGSNFAVKNDNLFVSNAPLYNGNSPEVYIMNKDAQSEWIITQTVSPETEVTEFNFSYSLVANESHLIISDMGNSDQSLSAGAFHVFDQLPQDTDHDGIVDALDNCIDIANPLQENSNSGVTGDACDGYEPVTDLQRLTAHDGFDDDYFGASFDVFNSSMVVGASGNNAAYIFKSNNGQWSQKQKLPNESDIYSFGASVSISGDYAMVGTYGTSYPKVNVYKYDSSTDLWSWHSLIDPGLSSDSRFGYKIKMWQDYAFISAHSADQVHVYQLSNNNEWILLQSIQHEDNGEHSFFGISVDVNENGLFIGAANASTSGLVIYYTQQEDGLWSRTRRIWPKEGGEGDFFGKSVAINGDTLIVGSPRHNTNGSVYIIDITTWQQTLLSSDSPVLYEIFGWSVASTDNYILVGAPNDRMYDNIDDSTGSAYLFEYIDDQWIQVEKLASDEVYTLGSDAFGTKVMLDNNQIYMGIDTEDGSNKGAVYVTELP